MNKDQDLIAEAYMKMYEAKKEVCKHAKEEGCDCDECPDCIANQKKEVNECWSKEQQDKYDTLVKDGYKEVKKDEGSKKITLKKGLDGQSREITIDVDGKEHVHYGESEEE